MTIAELKDKFLDANENFSKSTQLFLGSSNLDYDTKEALDEISRQAYYAIVETQDAIIKYLEEK